MRPPIERAEHNHCGGNQRGGIFYFDGRHRCFRKGLFESLLSVLPLFFNKELSIMYVTRMFWNAEREA